MMSPRHFLASVLSLALLPAGVAYAELGTTRFVSLKVYEELEIKTTDGNLVFLGQGQLSRRPERRPTSDWRQIGKSFGMRENPAFCASKKIEDLLQLMTHRGDLLFLASRLESENRSQLTSDEAKKLAATPLCQEMQGSLENLARLVPYYPESAPAQDTTGGVYSLMIVNTTLSDEGHGWVVLNNRLTNGQQAIIHTGHKVKQAHHYSDGLVAKRTADITSKIAQQPFAMRKVLRQSTSEKLPGERSYSKTCTNTEYRNQCTYDPVTKQGKCERVPYTIEGTRVDTHTPVEETRINDFEFLNPVDNRVLAILTLETKIKTTDIDYGSCATEPVPDYPGHPYPYPMPHPQPYPAPLAEPLAD